MKIVTSFGSLDISLDSSAGIYTFQTEKIEFKARVIKEKYKTAACFFEINGKPFDSNSINESLLFQAEAFFQKEKISFVAIEVGKEQLSYPPFESLENLPQLEGSSKILASFGHYDGPISGVVEIDETKYFFDWCMDALDSSFRMSPRVFSVRKVPNEFNQELITWIGRYQELLVELKLVNNLHIYPVSDWQKAVSQALKAEDQNVLDQLFSKKPGSINENYIFKFSKTEADGTIRHILRDHNGQRLPETFWMTSLYSIQDLTYLP